MSKLLKLSFVLLSTVVLVASENPWVGTWKLNAAKSTLTSYPKTAKELTATVRDVENQTIDVALKGTATDGTPISRRYTTPKDGGATNFLEGVPPAGITENTSVVNDKVRDSTTTRDGKTISTSHFVMSDDGKSITITTKGITPSGKPLDETALYEKQ
jgi:hypothetical protein